MEGASVFRDRGAGSVRRLSALNSQLLSDLDPPLLSLRVKKLQHPEKLRAHLRFGKAWGGSALAGGGVVRKLRTEQEERGS